MLSAWISAFFERRRKRKFIKRFTARILEKAGPDPDGKLTLYAAEAAEAFWTDPFDPDDRNDPEGCADVDMSYWEE